jgi:hypothetical protein
MTCFALPLLSNTHFVFLSSFLRFLLILPGEMQAISLPVMSAPIITCFQTLTSLFPSFVFNPHRRDASCSLASNVVGGVGGG